MVEDGDATANGTSGLSNGSSSSSLSLSLGEEEASTPTPTPTPTEGRPTLTKEESLEPPSILKQSSRLSSDERPRPGRSLSWIDDKGGGLVEVHYREQLHYSLHSRDKEVVRRQQLRNGCAVDDNGLDLTDRQRRSCCAIS